MSLEIVSRDYKRVSVLRVLGRIDSSTAAQFEAKINEHIKAGHSHLVLEMDATEFLSSAGVRAMISAQKELKGKGGEVSLAQPSSRVIEVLELAGLGPLFNTYSTTEAAVGEA
jgi:anti-sigma B factor antagonist